MSEPLTLFCFGAGFTAVELNRDLDREQWRAIGTTREAAGLSRLNGLGVEAHLFDRSHPLDSAAALLARADFLLVSIPPDAEGDSVLDLHTPDIAAAGARLRWIGYLSTTGVYGNTDGAWVDEDSPLRPTGERSRRRVEAERRWLAFGEEHGLPVHVFRLAGIYGPGRSSLDALRAGRAKRIDKPGQVFSRIHVADIAQVLRASMARPTPGAVYNVCDDEPAPASEVVAFAARLLGMEPPPTVPLAEADLSPMARSFYADNRRVRNDRIKKELGVELRYPTFREGLRACLAAEAQGAPATESESSATVAHSRSRSGSSERR